MPNLLIRPQPTAPATVPALVTHAAHLGSLPTGTSASPARQQQPKKPRCFPNFDDLPDSASIRQCELIRSGGNPAAPLPFSAPTLWRKVKAGTFPKPTKLSTRVTAWQVGQVRAWMAAQAMA